MSDPQDDLPEPLRKFREIVRRMRVTGEFPCMVESPAEFCPRCGGVLELPGIEGVGSGQSRASRSLRLFRLNTLLEGGTGDTMEERKPPRLN
jgi:hypothetical protein